MHASLKGLHSRPRSSNNERSSLPAAETSGVESYANANGRPHFAHDFSQILTVGSDGDIFEQEADRIGSQVMSVSTPQPAVMGSTRGIVRGAPQSSGRPLDSTVRNFFEPRLGHDLERVRVHTDQGAVQSVDALDARACTYGSDIFYDRGERPGVDSLTAHELVHVIQNSVMPPGVIRRSPRGSGASRTRKQARQDLEQWRREAFAELASMKAEIAVMKTDLAVMRAYVALEKIAVGIAIANLIAAADKAKAARENTRKWTRIAAVPKIIGSAVEAAFGCATAETGVGAIACIHGLGAYKSNWDELWHGEPSRTPIQETITAIAREFADDDNADVIGDWADILVGALTLSMASGKSPKTPRGARTAGAGHGMEQSVGSVRPRTFVGETDSYVAVASKEEGILAKHQAATMSHRALIAQKLGGQLPEGSQAIIILKHEGQIRVMNSMNYPPYNSLPAPEWVWKVVLQHFE